MFGISFFKVPPLREFNYRPRYYDPDKERREKKRLKMRAEKGELDDDEEVKAGNGSLIRSGAMRSRHEAFRDSMVRQKKKSQIRLIILVVILSGLFYYLIRDYWDVFIEVITK